MKTDLCIHSTVDVITNSSSEIFVCETDKPVEAVRQMLQELLSLWNAQSEQCLTFEEVFGYIGAIRPDDKDMFDRTDEYAYKNYMYDSVKKKGTEDQLTVIESASDNAIPYAMWDWINDVFNGSNTHLG